MGCGLTKTHILAASLVMSVTSLLMADSSVTDFGWLEQLSRASNVVLAFAALWALQQVRAAIKQARAALEQNRISLDQLKLMAAQLEVSRADITVRSRRESIAVALEQCKRFAELIVPHTDQISKELAAKGYFSAVKANPDFPFVPVAPNDPFAKIWNTHEDLRTKAVHAMNELESFAMYFATDLADESVAFPPTAQSFCQICERYQLFIGAYRQPDSVRLYPNLVKLYGMWKPRVERTVLEEQGKVIESKKQKLPAEKKGTPLGTVL